MPLGAFKINSLARRIIEILLGRTPVVVNGSGDAQISTAQSQFGGASLLLDGNGDFITMPFDTNIGKWDSNSGYTVEYWIRLNSLVGTSYPDGAPTEIPTAIGNHTPTSNVNFWSFGPISNGNVVFFYFNGGKIATQTTGVTIDTNEWYHLAFVYNTDDTYKIFVDGVERASATVQGTPQFSADFPMTHGAAGSSTQFINGFTDELRISNTARYTTNFTPQTQPHVNDANTLLLLHMDGTNGSTDFVDDSGANISLRSDPSSSFVRLLVPFDASSRFNDLSNDLNSASATATNTIGPASTMSTAQIKWNTTPNYGASYLGNIGLGAALTYTLSTPIPSADSGTYVVEGWFYANSTNSNSNWCLSSADSGGRWLFGINNSTTFGFGNENNLGIGTEWNHIAIVCDAGNKRLYHNAVFRGNWISSNTGFSTLHVGQFNPSDLNDYRGHIQDLRVTIGNNRGYTGTSTSPNFTLPNSLIESF